MRCRVLLLAGVGLALTGCAGPLERDATVELSINTVSVAHVSGRGETLTTSFAFR